MEAAEAAAGLDRAPSAPSAGAVELLLALLGRRRRLRVAGTSMQPTLRAGEVVLLDPRAYRRSSPAPGDVVVLRHPYRRGLRIVKRVHALLADGRVTVHGDDPAESTDSRAFGPVEPGALLGRVTARL